MTPTAPPPDSRAYAIEARRLEAKQPAPTSYFAPAAPVNPAEAPKPAAPVVPDYAAMRRAEVACLTERDAVSRTERRSKALFALIAANPARMQDPRLRYAIPMSPMPPMINEKAALPEGAICAR